MDPARIARSVRLALLVAGALAVATTAPGQEPRPEAPTRPAAERWLVLDANTGYAHPDPDAIRRDVAGSVSSCAGELRFYVHLAKAGALEIDVVRSYSDRPLPVVEIEALPAGVPITAAQRHVSHASPRSRPQNRTWTSAVYTAAIAAPGYHRITLRMPDGSDLGSLARIAVGGEVSAEARASTVERRNAASVHLGYEVPAAHRDDIEWFYCEITPRTDPLWSYYMATGWHRGYFGMQVNSPTERRLIFSVWDSGGEPIDREKVAPEDRVQLIAKGEHVHASGFGNEGTGGHSHLVHDWQVGRTFRFLVHAKPDGTHTIYTGWFWFADREEWGLIASFRAPKDGKRLRGLYSFDENFSGANGDLLRDCEFGNAWVRTVAGEWLPLTAARFTHDGHGAEQRLDRCAGVRGDRFYLRTGGFVPAPDGAVTAARAMLEVPRPAGKPPEDAELPASPPAPTGK